MNGCQPLRLYGKKLAILAVLAIFIFPMISPIRAGASPNVNSGQQIHPASLSRSHANSIPSPKSIAPHTSSTFRQQLERNGATDAGTSAFSTSGATSLAGSISPSSIGHPHFYQPHSLGQNGIVAGQTSNMVYNGGPVMTNPTIYAIFWIPAGYSFEPNIGGNDTRYELLILNYFFDVSNTPFYNILTQYYGNNGLQYPSNMTTFGGYVIHTGSFPNNEGSQTNPLLDSDIRTGLTLFIQAHQLTAGLNQEFFVYTPYGVESCFDTAHTECSFPAPRETYCAYHDSFTLPDGTPVIYANMPDVSGLGLHCSVPSSPNGDSIADLEITAAAHEQFESVSDPTGDGWYIPGLPGQGSTEIGDACNGDYGTTNSDGSNIVLNGYGYIIQHIWSNFAGGCAQSFHPNFVTIKLNPADPSGLISSSDYFDVAFSIGRSALDLQYHGLAFNATVDPSSTILVYGNSTKSGPSEEWCFTQSCQNISMMTATDQTIRIQYSYYDMLPVKLSAVSAPSGSTITVNYSTAPGSPSTNASPTSSSMPLVSDRQVWVLRGSSVSTSTTAPASWRFEGWAGTGTGSYSGSGELSAVVNAQITEKATFYPGITIGSVGVSVSYTDGSISGTVPSGTTTTIYVPIASSFTSSTSTPDGWQFEVWTGSGTGSYSGTGQLSLSVSGPVSEQATFYPGVTISAVGSGSVSYTAGSLSGTVPSGGSSTIYVPLGTKVVVTSSSSSLLYTFSGWNGAITGDSSQTSFSVTSPVQIGARFGYNFLTLGAIGVIPGAAIGGTVFLVRRRSSQKAKAAGMIPQYQPVQYPTAQYPPGTYPGQQYPPGTAQPAQYPYQPGQYPAGQYPPPQTQLYPPNQAQPPAQQPIPQAPPVQNQLPQALPPQPFQTQTESIPLPPQPITPVQPVQIQQTPAPQIQSQVYQTPQLAQPPTPQQAEPPAQLPPSTPPQVSPSTSQYGAQDRKMQFCPFCGTRVVEGAKFCHSCGKQF